MVGKYRDGNKTTYDSCKLVLLSKSQNDWLKVYGITNSLHKLGLNTNKVKKQKIKDTLQKYVEDKGEVI